MNLRAPMSTNMLGLSGRTGLQTSRVVQRRRLGCSPFGRNCIVPPRDSADSCCSGVKPAWTEAALEHCPKSVSRTDPTLAEHGRHHSLEMGNSAPNSAEFARVGRVHPQVADHAPEVANLAPKPW